MTTTLPATDWTRSDACQQLATALGAENIRWVGGAVRDTLLGVPVKDIDAATIHRPDRVQALCQAAGIRTVPTGIAHGTITAVFDNASIEITTLRKDISTDGRRAIIGFTDKWWEDAKRRDFTINALYAHPDSLEVADFFGGLGDLTIRRVRFIGDARKRIDEDHLRILRYYRFQARLGAPLDAEAEEACADMAGTMKGLSRERVSMELLALLALPDPAATICRMHDRGVLGVILPETTGHELDVLSRLVKTEKAFNTPPAPIRRLAALMPTLVPVVQTVSARLRLSRRQRAQLICLAERGASDTQTPFALAYREGLECARSRLLLLGESPAPLADWHAPRLPLKGGEIVAKGVTAGPQVARILQAVEARWIAEGFPHRARVQDLLEEELAAEH